MRITDLKFQDYVAMLLRENSRFILIVSISCCVASFVVSGMLMDDLYLSEAEIRVLYAPGTPVGSRSSSHSVVLVRERLTRQSLEKVIVDNGLYEQERRNGSLEEALKATERDISTSSVRDDVVRLAFHASDPGLAQRVTRQLVSQYEDSVSHIRTREDQDLVDLADQIKKAEADLASQEEKLKDFNLRFLGGHLEKQTATLATLNRLVVQLQSNADLLSALQEQKSTQEKFLSQQDRRPTSESIGGSTEVQKDQRTGGDSAQPAPSGLTHLEIQGKIDQFNKEIEQRKRQQAEIRREMAVYQARIDSAPKVRALQSQIVRDYENSKRRYQELLAKKNQIEIAKAANKKSEPGFQVLSHASFPDAPSNSQNRLMVRLSGLLWGPLVAIGLAALRSTSAGHKVTLDEVISQSGVPILASIPWIPLGGVRPNSQSQDRDHDQPST